MIRLATAAGLIALTTASAPADPAGAFDFYVLALTWSPSYCAYDDRPDPAQCDLDLPGFVVHGLWPQYERGYPEYCESDMSPRVPASTLTGISDILPFPGAAAYQWRKHGICSGLRPERYFALVRQAAGRVAIPEPYVDLKTDMGTQARTIEADFVADNPGLSDRGIAVTCNRDGVIEVRICLTKRLDFRRCEEVDRNACRRPVRLPAAD